MSRFVIISFNSFVNPLIQYGWDWGGAQKYATEAKP